MTIKYDDGVRMFLLRHYVRVINDFAGTDLKVVNDTDSYTFTFLEKIATAITRKGCIRNCPFKKYKK